MKFFKSKIIIFLKKLKSLLSEESKETKIMLKIYAKYLMGSVSKDDIRLANKQLLELLKTLGFGGIAIIPFSFFIFPLLIKISRSYGVELLPESFLKRFKL